MTKPLHDTSLIIYDKTTGIPSRIVTPDAGEDINKHVAIHVRPHEGYAQVATNVVLGSLPYPALVKPGGTPSLPVRCTLIDDSGNVANVVMANPEVDTFPGFTLLPDETAGPGWTWTQAGGFVGPPPPAPPPNRVVSTPTS